MNDAQILADIVARRGMLWVGTALEVLAAAAAIPPEAPVGAVPINDRSRVGDTRNVTTLVGITPDPWDPAVNPDVEARGPGWVKMKRAPTQAEALAADPDRDFGNGPGVQVDADGNVTLAPVAPLPFVEPTIDFSSRPGVNDPTGYEGA